MMHLQALARGKNDVLAVARQRNGQLHCEVTEFLDNLPAAFSSNAKEMKTLLRRYAEGGPLTTAQFHQAGGDGIWRFAKGRLRIYCFKDEGRLIIATHGALKKTQATDSADLRQAEEAKRLYFAEKERDLNHANP